MRKVIPISERKLFTDEYDIMQNIEDTVVKDTPAVPVESSPTIISSSKTYYVDNPFSGTMDDIPDGVAYVKTENNLTDALVSTIGTALQPQTSDDIEITDATKGVILTSPDASRWRITVDNAGVLTTAKI